MPASDPRPALVWLRDDLRLADNPALAGAAESGRPVVLAYVLDEGRQIRPLGAAARWWLGRALADLADAIAARGGTLVLRRGDPAAIIPALAGEVNADAIHWNRRYDAPQIAQDTALKATQRAAGRTVASHNATLLHEPWNVATQSGGPFKVYTPFARAAQQQPVRAPLPEPEALRFAPAPASEKLADWHLEPSAPDWAGGLRASWQPGEDGARAALERFLAHGLAGYAENRDRPDRENVSRLSPYLRFGNISPHQVLAATRHAEAAGTAGAKDAAKFVAELYWREFAYHLLYHFPDLATANFNARFDGFGWGDNPGHERAWQRGLTGYPIVDAGMRQLWETGWMHNRVRMIVASFLIKDALVDWRRGEDWFWDTLVDACPANNPASWQWVAGSGADAAPYFRIFNPVTQGEKFDPDGDYVRRYIPELARLPAEAIHKPWAAKPDVLRRAGVTLGLTYPHPILDHAVARERALAHYEAIRG
ncbi:cryptochrome/photolyase family protein [Ancylobacter sp. SL191]|uniref:cryptochrome/photolyase family protein n=1 Tax=Ancylobacter sp. SL191 TaxID=2995166 RepID=UPI00226FCDF2|nr:deoxyribodipyrimidine photo-lyase [Ancylobacter sp. SL191]WAC26788.1 deoxyribodipyrimidine photo-lyase [Ancylobacter sp. SL191]